MGTIIIGLCPFSAADGSLSESFLLDPHSHVNVQRSAARFIMKDYHSRQEGCVTAMLKHLNLRSSQRFKADAVPLYKVVEGLVPAMNKDYYKQPQRQRRTIRATRYTDFDHKNIVENYITNNSKCFKPIPSKTDETHSLSEQFTTGTN